MKTIELTKGMQALVSDEDYERVSKFKWYANEQGRRGWEKHYAARNQRRFELAPGVKRKKSLMHRFIMGLELGDSRVVHHIDNDGLNNQRLNLEILEDNVENMNESAGWRGSQKTDAKDPFLAELEKREG